MRACVAIVAASLACGAGRSTLVYRNLASVKPAASPFPGKVVVLLPYDDRYDGERDGETMTAKFTVALPGAAIGSYRGNHVTGDHRFEAAPGPFGSSGIAQSVGNLLVVTLTQARFAEVIEADDGSANWSCANGTCTPDPDAIREIAMKTGATFVLVTRLAHFYGTRFGDKFTAASTHNEVRGADLYSVTQTLMESRTSGVAGACVLEITVFKVKDARVVATSRRSFSGTAYADRQGDLALSEVAVDALNASFDRMVREVPAAMDGLRLRPTGSP